MKNPFLFLAINDYISRIVSNSYFKNITVQTEGINKGAIYYDVGDKTNKIPALSNPEQIINNTVAGLLIMEGYSVVNALDNTFVVSNNKGDSYFITGNSCSCPDRFNPCKHVLFTQWYLSFRKEQVKLLHKTKN